MGIGISNLYHRCFRRQHQSRRGKPSWYLDASTVSSHRHVSQHWKQQIDTCPAAIRISSRSYSHHRTGLLSSTSDRTKAKRMVQCNDALGLDHLRLKEMIDFYDSENLDSQRIVVSKVPPPPFTSEQKQLVVKFWRQLKVRWHR